MQRTLSIIAVYTALLVSCGPGGGQSEQASAPAESSAGPSSPASVAGQGGGTAVGSQRAGGGAGDLGQKGTSGFGTVGNRACGPNHGPCHSGYRETNRPFS